MKIHRGFVRWLIFLFVLLGVMSFTTDSYAAARFGTLCQQDFQNSWRENFSYAWARCSGFNNELDDTDIKAFYYNLHGAKNLFSTCDGCNGGVDTVHLLYVNTHGGGWENDATLTMWEKDTRAMSNQDNWRFGNNDTGVAFFAQYACETLKHNDGKTWDRWINTFRGGLIMAMGSHDKLWDGLTTDETGEDFADDLQKSKTVKWAWFDGNGDWAAAQDVAVLATGSSKTAAKNAKADCEYRRDNVKWQNFGGYARWRDSDIGWMCWSWIDDN